MTSEYVHCCYFIYFFAILNERKRKQKNIKANHDSTLLPIRRRYGLAANKNSREISLQGTRVLCLCDRWAKQETLRWFQTNKVFEQWRPMSSTRRAPTEYFPCRRSFVHDLWARSNCTWIAACWTWTSCTFRQTRANEAKSSLSRATPATNWLLWTALDRWLIWFILFALLMFVDCRFFLRKSTVEVIGFVSNQ